ncbi:MAG TPA: hypothetical protein VG297_24305, partial [Bryobacteraceae bacterium]|nr:hypothetical protein [Bryobacteraceae bacterium]
MAKIPVHRVVKSNPRTGSKRKGSGTMTAAQKKAFVARMKAARKKNPSNKSKSKAGGKKKNHSHSNPSRRKSRKGTRNPQILGRSPKSLFIQILTALIAGAATKQLPQELMAASNTGWKGYLANLATGGAATLGAHALLGPDEAFAAALGSGVVILDRVLTENFSPIGNYLALTGLGDATAARQLGGVGDGYFIQPTIYDANGNPVIPHQITDMAVQRFLALQP